MIRSSEQREKPTLPEAAAGSGKMTREHRGRAFARAALALVGSMAATAAAAETLRAHYALSLIGFSIGHASAAGVVEGRRYRVDISMRTTGLASLVNDTHGSATATGALSKNGPAPSNYANTTSNPYETRTVHMALADNAVRAVDVQPTPWDISIRVPLSESNKAHIIDPVSALIMAVPQGESLTGPAACNRTIPVFDGVTRFDVSLAYVETREVATRGYSGPVSVCAARYTPIAGHRPDSVSTKYMAENGDINVWLAPVPGAHVVVPYRIAIRTSAGMLTVEASEFQLGQRHAADR